jgi:hypothetical protein
MSKFSKLEYCQYRLSSPVNYTLTNLAEHWEGVSHDRINQYLKEETLTPRLLWQEVEDDVITSPLGYIIFDDSVLDKRFSCAIECSQVQYSGNEHGLVRGIGLVSCIYVNPELGQYWLIDYRIYDKASDGYSKLDPVQAMLEGAVNFKHLPFRTVLMDSWYASRKLMALIEELGKIYYCPLKRNRLVDDAAGVSPYRQIQSLDWSESELETGKLIKIRHFPADKKVKLFRVTVSSHRTDFVVTNDITQDSTQATHQECGVRWKIEVVHRELKQLTGIESCQCRKGRIQRNHIHCALLVWDFLRRQAREQSVSLYQIAYQPLSDFLRQQLAHPSLAFSLA